jgi:hypothetical protein
MATCLQEYTTPGAARTTEGRNDVASQVCILTVGKENTLLDGNFYYGCLLLVCLNLI